MRVNYSKCLKSDWIDTTYTFGVGIFIAKFVIFYVIWVTDNISPTSTSTERQNLFQFGLAANSESDLVQLWIKWI